MAHDPSIHLATGTQLEAEHFPSLGTVSAAHFYTFQPVPREPSPPELIYLPRPEKSDEAAYLLAVATWNSLWESGPLRPDGLADQRAHWPACLHWLLDLTNGATDIRLIPHSRSSIAAFDILYHLLPLKVLRQFGLPPLKRGLWPATPWSRDDVAGLMPTDFQERLSHSFANLVWPLLSPRTRMKDLSKNESLRLLAHNLDFWLPYIDVITRQRARAKGRAAYDVEHIDKQRARHRRLRKRYQNAAFTAERPLTGGFLWYGESEAWEATKEVVHAADRAGHLRAIIDALRSHRVQDDFSDVWSWEREDFERKLFSKRSKVRISFVQLNDTLPVHSPDSELRERLLWSDLLALLDTKERAIVVCLRNSETQLEAASLLGYANHSAVSKALRRIRDKARKVLG